MRNEAKAGGDRKPEIRGHAAARAVKPTKQCPHCGTMRDADDARVYECPRCGTAGFDCCVPGRNTLCWNCDRDDGS